MFNSLLPREIAPRSEGAKAGLVAFVASSASIKSMAGITLVRWGVPLEKYNVASLNTCGYVSKMVLVSTRESKTHLKDVLEILRNVPIIVREFIVSKSHPKCPSKALQGSAIRQSEIEHVEC